MIKCSIIVDISNVCLINQLLDVFMTESVNNKPSFGALVLSMLFMPVCTLPGVYLLVLLETSKPTNHPSSPSFVAMETRQEQHGNVGKVFSFLSWDPPQYMHHGIYQSNG